MKTIDSIMSELTDVKKRIEDLKEILRIIDLQFPAEEARFEEAKVRFLERVGDRITPSAAEYLDAHERNFISSVIYIAGQGFKRNLDIFNNPAASLFLLCGEFEDITRERMLDSVPGVQEAGKTILSFHDAVRALPEAEANEIWALTEGITDMYSYLETAGYKLAHYFGFAFADRFLPYVVPDYQCDPVNTVRYRRMLVDYTEMDLILTLDKTI